MLKEKSTNLFDDLIEQKIAIGLLEAALKKQRIAPAYLFAGPEGVGRSLAARRFIEGLITGGLPEMRERNRLMKLNHPDLIWVEPTYIFQGKLVPKSLAKIEPINKRSTPQIRLDQIREIQRFLARKPIETKLAMVVIESVETINESASNALLKTLEEPGNGLLILISARPERLLPTIRSRCQKIPFSRLKTDALKKVLSQLKINTTDEFLFGVNEQELIDLANGSPGALIENLKTWHELPEEIWGRLKNLPKSPLGSLALARDITEQLDVEQQIWLINWLQHYIWIKHMNSNIFKDLENLRSHLISYVQPRLAWEVILLKIAQY